MSTLRTLCESVITQIQNVRPVFHRLENKHGVILDFAMDETAKSIPEMILIATELVIDPEDIIFLVKEMTTLRMEGNKVDWYTSAGILLEMYPGDADRMFCVSERMRCLMPLMNEPRMRGWTFEDRDPECTITNEAVFHAVAKCPLRLDENKMWFDADEFFRIVLEECEPQANA